MNNIPDFLPDLLEKQYGADHTRAILGAYSCRRRVTLRANTLKSSATEVRDALKQAGIASRPVTWYADAFVLENADENAVRELPLYQEGKIYLQSLSSMLPPLALTPRAGADILDMAAAPGGKTTQMAALSGNQAHITACELNPIRAKRLRYNIEKQGASCVYVMQKDARTLDDFFAFDQILLDAPCSGSGVLDTADPHLGEHFTRKLIDKSVKAQRALLTKAVTLLKKGQELVYSTCSILACENEDIIKAALSGGKAELVPISPAPWQKDRSDARQEEEFPRIPLLPTSLEGCVCVAPDEFYEGFFLAKLRRK